MGKMRLQRRIGGLLLVLACLIGQGERIIPVQAQGIIPAQAQITNIDEEIVYLDTSGFIRVLEPQVTTGQQTVQWVSPVGGWRDFVLGDFNGDGDAEIVAVSGDSTSGRLTIYDPVIASGLIDSSRVINNVPWAILYETALPGAPVVVGAGDLVPTIAGDEIAYIFELNPDDRPDSDNRNRLAVLQPVAGVTDGRNWTEAIAPVNFDNTWDRISLGDLDNVAGDEIILVDRSGFVSVLRVNGSTLATIFANESGARPWQDGIAAQWVPGSLPELLMGRSSPPGGATFWTFYYNPGSSAGFSDGYTELMLPTPRLLFAGDINNNGDKELFFLRTVPSNLGNRARLFMRNAGTDSLPVFEQTLDTDNGYLGGDAGDTDGDGRAEVVVMRNNNLRIFTQPENTSPIPVDTVLTKLSNGLTLHLGNLDAVGVVATPQLAASASQITQLLSSGADPSTSLFSLSNASSGAPGAIPFTATVIDNPTWLTVSPSSGETPANLTLTFDPGRLAAGSYAATISVNSSSNQVLNLPLTIAVSATVREGLRTNVDQLTYSALPCAVDSAPQQQSITLDGPNGWTFAAEIATDTGSATAYSRSAAPQDGIEWPTDVGWVTASSPNVLPTTMVLTFAPSAVSALRSTALLQLNFFDEAGAQSRTIGLSLFCATQQLFLPLVAR